MANVLKTTASLALERPMRSSLCASSISKDLRRSHLDKETSGLGDQATLTRCDTGWASPCSPRLTCAGD